MGEGVGTEGVHAHAHAHTHACLPVPSLPVPLSDESHYIKTHSQMAKACWALEGDRRWCVTGTPFNTSVLDLLGQLKFLRLHGFDDHQTWESKCVKPFASFQKHPSNGPADSLSALLLPLRHAMVRHEKTQLWGKPPKPLLTLPPKVESMRIIKWGDAAARRKYRAEEQRALKAFNEIKEQGVRAVSKNTIKLLALLRPLRMLCSNNGHELPDGRKTGTASLVVPLAGVNCPVCHSLPDAPSAPQCGHVYCHDCVEGLCSQAKDSALFKGQKKPGDCVVCRQPVGAAADLVTVLAAESQRKKPGNAGLKAFAAFAKTKALLEELRALRRRDSTAKTLIFSQFKATLEGLKQVLTQNGFQFRTLTGDMSLKKRQQALSQFQMDPPTTVFLLSIRAGAVGINLTQVALPSRYVPLYLDAALLPSCLLVLRSVFLSNHCLLPGPPPATPLCRRRRRTTYSS